MGSGSLRSSMMIANGTHIATAQQIPTSVMNMVAYKGMTGKRMGRQPEGEVRTHLENRGDEEGREGQQAEEEHRAGPDVAQKEGHHGKSKWASSLGTLYAPFSNEFLQVVEFFVLGFVLIPGQDTAVTSSEMREDSPSDNTHCA